MSEKRPFKIRATYFKPSGKYYTEAEFDLVCQDCGPPGHPCCYMNDVAAYIRGLRQGGGQGVLPGLLGTWPDGFILIDCEEGHPVLILPAKEQ